MQQSIKQAEAGVVVGGEDHVQPVTERHKLIDLGDDAVLFGEWWEGNWKLSQDAQVQTLVGNPTQIVLDMIPKIRRQH